MCIQVAQKLSGEDAAAVASIRLLAWHDKNTDRTFDAKNRNAGAGVQRGKFIDSERVTDMNREVTHAVVQQQHPHGQNRLRLSRL